MHPFSNLTLSSSTFSPSSLLQNVPNFKPGLCNSNKRVSKSPIYFKNHGGIIGFRYSVPLQENGGGFFHSLKRVSKSHGGLMKSGGLVSVSCKIDSQGKNDDDDGYYMRRAVELARTAIGYTSPNPMVGCVIVKDGKIVGEGFHPKAGQPHAEVFALRDAGDLAENATTYVSLEPCNHYGRTPPCSEALIKAKLKKVVVGMVDPNPIVASTGVDKLRGAGIEVTVGVEEDLCKKLNEAYIYRMLTGTPFITLRYSLSINGCFLNQLGEEATEPGGYYSKLLQQYDAIICSPKTPFPSSKEVGANQPLQIIIANDTSPIEISNDLTTEANTKVIIFTDKQTSVESETAHKGIETVVLKYLNSGPILEYCESRGLCSVLIDLRGNVSDLEDLVKEFIDQNLVQKFVIEMVPICEDRKNEDSKAFLNFLGKRLKNLSSTTSGKSAVLEGYFL